MKKLMIIVLAVALMFLVVGCLGENPESADREVVQEQQAHYQKTQPLPYYEYSIPRDIFIQISDVVVTKAYTTYTVIESITGETKFHGPSLGYGIPADTQLTNPLQLARDYSGGPVIEQAEPNGLFSSDNTDGTWVLFVQPDGNVVPVYTEHKVTTYPFPVEQDESGSWVRTEGSETNFVIDINETN